MSKAHKAPMDTYKRVRTISKHALERFRERFAPWLTKTGMLDDQSVMNLLDQLVAEALENEGGELVCDGLANGALTTLIELNDPARFGNGVTAVAVERDRTVVTVLTYEMVENNKRSGSYYAVDGKGLKTAGHKPFAKLKDLGVKVAAPKAEVPYIPPVAPAATFAPVPPVTRAFADVLAAIKRRASEAFMDDNDETANRYRCLAQELTAFIKENP